MQHRRSGQSRGWMALDGHLPEQTTGRSIDGVRVPARITEERGVSSRFTGADAADADRRSHDRARVERPVHATGPRVQRVDVAGNAADEEAATDDGDAGPGLDVTRKAKGPLQLEPRNIGSGQSRSSPADIARWRDSARSRSRRVETNRSRMPSSLDTSLSARVRS